MTKTTVYKQHRKLQSYVKVFVLKYLFQQCHATTYAELTIDNIVDLMIIIHNLILKDNTFKITKITVQAYINIQMRDVILKWRKDNATH